MRVCPVARARSKPAREGVNVKDAQEDIGPMSEVLRVHNVKLALQPISGRGWTIPSRYIRKKIAQSVAWECIAIVQVNFAGVVDMGSTTTDHERIPVKIVQLVRTLTMLCRHPSRIVQNVV
jgi:hypothetical protein